MRTFVTAIVAVLITASACSTSHSSSSAKVHAKSVAQQGQEVIDTQKQIPPLQTAAQFCLDGIKKDSKDTAIDEALNTIDPRGGEAAAWEFSNLQGDQVTMQKELADGKLLSGTFDLGQIIYAIIGSAGEQATKGSRMRFSGSCST